MRINCKSTPQRSSVFHYRLIILLSFLVLAAAPAEAQSFKTRIRTLAKRCQVYVQQNVVNPIKSIGKGKKATKDNWGGQNNFVESQTVETGNKKVDQILNLPQVKSIMTNLEKVLAEQAKVTIEPEVLRDIKVINTVGDRFVVQRASGLSLVRNVGVVKSEYQVLKLRGQEFLRSRSFGEVTVVITKSEAVRDTPALYHLHIVEDNATTATVVDSLTDITEAEIDGVEGKALMAGQHAVLLVNPKSNIRLTKAIVIDAPAKIHTMKRETINGMTFFKVSYSGKYVGSIYLDYESLSQSAVIAKVFSLDEGLVSSFYSVRENQTLLTQQFDNGYTEILSISKHPSGRIVTLSESFNDKLDAKSLKLIENTEDSDILTATSLLGKPKTIVILKKEGQPSSFLTYSQKFAYNGSSYGLFMRSYDGKFEDGYTEATFFRKGPLLTAPQNAKWKVNEQRQIQITFQGKNITRVENKDVKLPFAKDQTSTLAFFNVPMHEGREFLGNSIVMIDMRTDNRIMLGEILDTKTVYADGNPYHVIISKNVVTKQVGLTIYDTTTSLLYNTKLNGSEWLRDINIAEPKTLELSATTKLADVKINPANKFIFLEGVPQDKEYKNLLYVFSYTGQSDGNKILYNVYQPKIDGLHKEDIVYVAEQSGSFNVNISNQSVIESFTNGRHRSMKIPGTVEKLKYDNQRLYVEGHYALPNRNVPVHARYSFKTLNGSDKNEFKPDYLLYEPRQVEVIDQPNTMKILVGSQETIVGFDQEMKFEATAVDQSVVLLEDEDGKLTKLAFEGILNQIVFTKGRVSLHGYKRLLTTSVPVERRFVFGKSAPEYTLINKLPEPVLVDSELAIKIYITEAIDGVDPRAVIFDNEGKMTEIPLYYKTMKKKAMDFFSMLFGTPPGEELANVVNHSPIASVKKKGDLIFVETGGKGESPRTYVYNLATKNMELSVPNLQGVVDLDEYRFYIGWPSSSNEAVVALYDSKANRYLKHFELGQVRVKVTAGSITRDHAKNHILFKTTNGATRVFDEKSNTFLGFIPQSITDEFKELNKKLGSILNEDIFASNLSPTIGRDNVIDQLRSAHPFEPSLRQDGNSKYIVIKGESGAGRTQMLQNHIADYMSGTGTLSEQALKPVFFQLDASMIKAGTMYRGTGQDKWSELERVAKAIRRHGYQLVVIIDDVDQLGSSTFGRAYNDDETDPFTQLARMKKKTPMDILVTSRPMGWENIMENASTFAAGFHEIDLAPMSHDETVTAIRKYLVSNYPGKKVIDDAELNYVVATVARLHANNVLPGTAFDLVKDLTTETLALCPDGSCKVTVQSINKKLAGKTGLPEQLISGDPATAKKYVDDLLAFMKSKVTGQDPGLLKIANAFAPFTVGMNPKGQPIFSVIIPGSTGVGKTETGRAFVQFVFKDPRRRLMIPGAKYPEGISAERINQVSELLVKHNRKYNFNLVMFDEIEKMDLRLVKILLEYLEGSITDNAGNTISTVNSMVIATSNLGQAQIRGLLKARLLAAQGDPAAAVVTTKEREMIQWEKILDHFTTTPELLGRFDDIVHYAPLRDDSARAVVSIYMEQFIMPDLRNKNISMEWDNAFLDLLAKYCLDDQFGARGTGKNIKRYFLNGYLAPAILNGTVQKGHKYLVHGSETGDAAQPMRFEVRRID